MEKCEDLDIQTPDEKRQRKIPSRLDDHPETAVRLNQKDEYRVSFYFFSKYCLINLVPIA